MTAGFHVGLATTLPPAPTGPAEFVAGALPALAAAARITCFVSDPAAVEPAIAQRFALRPLAERDDPSVDLLVYHIANNLHQVAIYDAAMAGPPGLLEIHDGSLHHMLATRMLASDDVDTYRHLLARTHGPAGDLLARLRLGGQPPGVELFLLDALGDLLDRHLGVVVHNRHASDLIALRAPAMPTWVVPLSAPIPVPAAPKAALGLPPGRLVVAHFGFVTRPKRPFLLLDAFAELQARVGNCHLLFAGEDDTEGELPQAIAARGLGDAVTVTGFLSREEMDALISTVDIVVSLRFPHVGETSATLGAALAAGRPVVVQETGSWAELPETAVLRVPATGDEVNALANALEGLARDPAARARLGDAARQYAAEALGTGQYAGGIVAAAQAIALGSRIPPARMLADRQAAVADFLAAAQSRLTTGALLANAWATLPYPAQRRASVEAVEAHLPALARLPAGGPRARLLSMGSAASLLGLLECVWGYNVEGFTPAPDEALPYGCAAFDVVACWDRLPADWAAAGRMLADINRVLEPGGLLVLTTADFTDAELAEMLDDAGMAPVAHHETDARPTRAAVAARKTGLPA